MLHWRVAGAPHDEDFPLEASDIFNAGLVDHFDGPRGPRLEVPGLHHLSIRPLPQVLAVREVKNVVYAHSACTPAKPSPKKPKRRI